MSENELQKYLVARIDTIEKKMDANFTAIHDRLFDMHGNVSGLRVKSGFAGLLGGLLAALLLALKSLFH